jgi:hypothetical protein
MGRIGDRTIRLPDCVMLLVAGWPLRALLACCLLATVVSILTGLSVWIRHDASGDAMVGLFLLLVGASFVAAVVFLFAAGARFLVLLGLRHLP